MVCAKFGWKLPSSLHDQIHDFQYFYHSPCIFVSPNMAQSIGLKFWGFFQMKSNTFFSQIHWAFNLTWQMLCEIFLINESVIHGLNNHFNYKSILFLKILLLIPIWKSTKFLRQIQLNWLRFYLFVFVFFWGGGAEKTPLWQLLTLQQYSNKLFCIFLYGIPGFLLVFYNFVLVSYHVNM